MKCLGQFDNTNKLCAVCSLYNRCVNKTTALVKHEEYINTKYNQFKVVIFNAAKKGKFFTSKQLYNYLLTQIDKTSKEVIAYQLLEMINKDNAFRIEHRRVIPIKAL